MLDYDEDGSVEYQELVAAIKACWSQVKTHFKLAYLHVGYLHTDPAWPQHACSCAARRGKVLQH
jgi:hypothetical protein